MSTLHKIGGDEYKTGDLHTQRISKANLVQISCRESAEDAGGVWWREGGRRWGSIAEADPGSGAAAVGQPRGGAATSASCAAVLFGPRPLGLGLRTSAVSER